jgi:hypothetical protein
MDFQQLRAALAAIHPWLPAVFLILAIWAPAAAIRRWLPALWEGPANWGPFGRSELTPAWKVLRKAWQAIPAAAAGALLAAIAAGQDPWAPVLGAVVGLGAPALHEVKKLLRSLFGGAPPSAAALLLLAMTVSVGAPACSSSSQQAVSAAELRATALAYNGASVALELLVAQHTARMAAIESPTDADVAKAQAVVERLHRARDVLDVARSWLEKGEGDEGQKALADATKLLELLVDELQADGVLVPEAVSKGLAVARAWTGAS